MRFTILKDKKISTEEINELERQFTDFIYENTGLTPTFFIHEQDYTRVPTELDGDGDTKPTKAYFTALTNQVHASYGTYGTDSVVMLVHRDNWIFDGIWGTNFSNVYHQYHVHLCRFDSKNVANSLGTLYHEWMHSVDVLIKTHTGFDINTLFNKTACWVSWDQTLVHANRFTGCKETPFKYIRWKENVSALQAIAPHLQKAYKARKEMYLEPYKKTQLKVISIIRAWLNRKNGVKK